MKKSKIIMMSTALICSVVSLSDAGIQTVYAVEGWTKDSGEWMYLDRKDQPISNIWKQSKEVWYYLGSDGKMIKDSLIQVGNGLYYVDKDGKRVQNDWVFMEGNWYYFGVDGKAYRRTSGFKKNINGKSYFFDKEGKLLTGWLDKEGNALSGDQDPFADGVYYAREDVLADIWLDYRTIDQSENEKKESLISGKDYGEYQELWMYFDSNSKRVKSSGSRPKQLDLGGITYGFDENGIMLPWWNRVASVSNADQSNPTSLEPAKFFAGYEGGGLLKNTWIWMYPSESLDEKDYEDQEYSWWRTNEKGEVYQNKIKEIDGKSYVFDGLGRMRTGFVLFDDRNTFVAQYDTSDWSSDQFVKGELLGMDKADLYLFAPDELNDGSMQAGLEVEVELQDGIYTFGFGSDGIAYGNRKQIRKVKESFYLNGLRLEADEEYGYGVVKDGDGNYRVVNTNGKIVTGKKVAVEDREGGWLIIMNNKFMARVEDEEKPRWHNGPDGPGFYHYDGSNMEDKYAGGLIVGYHSLPNTNGLLSEEKLNFK